MAPICYCIRIEGHLSADWSDWFGGMIVRCQPDGTTMLVGPVRDQAALQGLLISVRDLGLSLISVNPIESGRQGGDEGQAVCYKGRPESWQP
jgi:hypothetical protein